MNHVEEFNKITEGCIKTLEDTIAMAFDEGHNCDNLELSIEILKVLKRCEDLSRSSVLWAIHAILVASIYHPKAVPEFLESVIDKIKAPNLENNLENRNGKACNTEKAYRADRIQGFSQNR